MESWIIVVDRQYMILLNVPFPFPGRQTVLAKAFIHTIPGYPTRNLLTVHQFEGHDGTISTNNTTVYMSKLGSKVKEGERAILDSSDLLWTDNVVHIGNYVNSACNDDVDCNIKKSSFIGYVNKLMANYGRLQTSVLINLFKSYCCSFDGLHLWKFNFTGFDKCCKSWNPGI